MVVEPVSDFLAKLIAEGKDLLGDAAKVPDREDTVEMDRFDLRDWEDLSTNVPAIKRIQVDMERQHDHVAQFLQDMFGLAFKANPNITPSEDMKPSHFGIHAVLVEINEMGEFVALRQHAVGDNYGSAMAMISMKEAIEEALSQAQKMTKEAAENAEAAQTEADQLSQELQDLLDQLAMQPATDPNAPPSALAGLVQSKMDQFDKAKKDAVEARVAAQQDAQQAAAGMRSALKASAGAAGDSLDQESALASSFGMEPGTLKKMPFDERLALAKRLKDNRLAKFVKLLGQFKMIQQAESRKRVVNASTEIHGITHSDDLSRLVAGEFLNFASPELETLFWLRYTQHQLVTFDVRGTEKQGQGPIIVVVDESGSMSCEDVAGGSREAWSKALSLAMLEQARHRSRDFVYIGFSSSGQQHTIRFPKGANNLEKVLEMTEHFWGGGTYYEAPLRQAMEIVMEYDEAGLPKPDVVFMSDDAYGAMDEAFMSDWNAMRDKTSAKCYGIAIGCSYSGAMEQVSDNVREITELASDPRVVGDLFRTI